MPELPFPKLHEHPIRSAGALSTPAPPSGDGFVELDITTNYTFLTGASHPDEFVQQAAALGMTAVGITDTNSLAGVVRAHVAAKEAGIRLVVGSRIVTTDGFEVLLYPTSRQGYAGLCTLLTLGKRRAPKGECRLTIDDVLASSDELLAVAVPSREVTHEFERGLQRLREAFDADRLSLAARAHLGRCDRERLAAIGGVSAKLHIPLVATNAPLYHAAHRRPLQDVLTCIRLGITLDEAGYALAPNAERHLKSADEMAALFAEFSEGIARSSQIAERTSGFSLDQLRYDYPHEVSPTGVPPMEYLHHLAWHGAAERYPEGVPPKVHSAIAHELGLIEELRYAPYFLTVYDLVRFARSRGILCQGRGAAANSAVCYCLGVTSVDPGNFDLLFERFMSKERNEPPDIDIDFEHERREEVIQYIYEKYGRDRAALTAEVITYRGKSAVRDVGKAMGFSLDAVDKLARTLDWWDDGAVDPARIRELGLDPNDRTLRLVLHLCAEILGFPRHLSQHVGGFVITETPLSELVPIENASMEARTVIEWDKDDIDAMGMLKVDCLGLGMLSCIRRCFELVRLHHGRDLTLATVPAEDPDVYDMICRADTLGVFQIESRAQMAMLPRLRPRCFYDLVIEVAIVRPGPIQGKMVHPYIRRRNGEEEITYPNEEVRAVLGRTLGVPLFQEQAMKMAIVAAGFTPGEADQLRRAMAAWKRKGNLIERFGQKMLAGMAERGYTRDFAERCFEQVKGFSSYGFPESHAASFALLVYVSCWLKHHHPGAFAAALINSQPMGFYQPAQIVRDAQSHGVTVRPVDVNSSDWDCTLEDDGRSLRLGMRLARSLSQTHAEAIARERVTHGPFRDIESLWRRTKVPVSALRTLARADAFGSLGVDRQGALWQLRGLKDVPLPLFDGVCERPEDAPMLPAVLPRIRVKQDYDATGLSLKAHPVSFLRDELEELGVVPARTLESEQLSPQGTRVKVAGLVLVRQRPQTASGIVFITLEDETGIANLIVRPRIFQRYRAAARHSPVILIHGTVERAGAVVHVQVGRIQTFPLNAERIAYRSRDFH